MKKSKNIYGVASIIGMAGYVFSYDASNLGGSMKFLRYYFNISASQIGILIAIGLIGNFIGSFLAGFFNDRYGRKKTMVGSLGMCIIGLVISALAWNVWVFSFGRCLFGIFFGLLFVAAPMYLVEISPADKRGRTGAIRQVFLAFGLIIGYAIAYLFEKYFSLGWNISTGWRYMALIEILIFVFMLYLYTRLLESPRWLMMKGRTEEAKEVLSQFTPDQQKVEKTYEDMKALVPRQDKKQKIKITGGLKYALLICIVFPIFRQMSGVNAITYYAQRIFADLSPGNANNAYFQSIFIGVSELLSAIFVVFYADRLGRKILLLVGALGMFVAEGLLSYFMYRQIVDSSAAYLIYIYNFFYIMSAGTMLTVYVSEAMPTVIRSKAASLSSMINWTFDALVIYLFPIFNANIYLMERFHGAFPFGIFAIFMFIFFIVIFFLPETKNKTLEEITDYWRGKGDWEEKI